MSTATEQELKEDLAQEEPVPETPEQRIERELASLREHGVLKKQLPTITRSTFEKLSPRSQMDFIRAGGTLANDPPPEKKPLPQGAIRRSTFDRMTPTVQWDFIRGGGELVDDDAVDSPARLDSDSDEVAEIKRQLKIKD